MMPTFSESNLRWVEESSSSTCISTLMGDPTEWVQKLIDDPDYEVDIEPYCISSDDGHFGVLKTNPNAPYIMITTDKQSGGLMSFSLMPEGLVIVQFGELRPYFDILIKNLDNPHELVIDPDEGYLFWAESTSIKRASLNPDSTTEILTGISSDTLLTLDRVEQKVFVLDQEQGSIQSMNYDGSDLKTVISGLKNDLDKTLAGIAAEQVDLVFDDNSSSTLGSIAMFNNTPIQSTKYVTDNFVLVTDVAESGIYQIDIDSNQILGLPIESTSNQRIEAAVYDPVENQVIWIDTGNGTLRSLVLEDGCTEKIIYTFTDESIVDDITLDKKERFIYYVDSGLSLIGRVSLTDSLAYWTDSLKENLEQIQFDGNKRKTIETVEGLYSVAIDKDFFYLLRTHDVRRYSLTNKPQSTLGLKIFSLLNDISFYSSTGNIISEDNLNNFDFQQLKYYSWNTKV
ncbi:hypothetical protein LSH36_425g00032 [Paralvinella palmiformis]|uniref:Uncharacterized protein n=1 Tax=Paralvinella palmiformis TaxID=53620 RepID=A0AAD9JCS9_9ANNE|nr:hypothetical protein LSH36_425g00032 [Paralvinella palmiformis]